MKLKVLYVTGHLWTGWVVSVIGHPVRAEDFSRAATSDVMKAVFDVATDKRF